MKDNYRIDNLTKLNNLAETIAKDVKVGDVICLTGDLGVGKTTFSKYLINNILDNEVEVTSPTFNLVQLYKSKNFDIWHFDLYRLKSKAEIYELGIDEAFDHGVSIIEWPEIINDLIPKNSIYLNFKFDTKNQNIRVIEVFRKG